MIAQEKPARFVLTHRIVDFADQDVILGRNRRGVGGEVVGVRAMRPVFLVSNFALRCGKHLRRAL